MTLGVASERHRGALGAQRTVTPHTLRSVRAAEDKAALLLTVLFVLKNIYSLKYFPVLTRGRCFAILKQINN